MSRSRSLLRSGGAWHGLVLSGSMVLAGGLDYVVNVVAGRWLAPAEFGVFVSVMAVVQVVTLFTIAIRMVVAYQVSTIGVGAEGAGRVAAFGRAAWDWAWRWGALATLAMALVAHPLARTLRLPGALPLLLASGMAFLLFLREAAFGVLQGTQRFGALGLVQVIQAALRVALCALLVGGGLRAPGAILAQPLAALACVALTLAWLRPALRAPPGPAPAVAPVRLPHAASIVAGLAVFGLLTNADALFVKHYFDPRSAGDYGPVVTLAKICLFLPWALGLVLFPKVARRRAAGVDPRPLLLLALAAALSPGLLLTGVYFLLPGEVVRLVFSGAYRSPGVVLGLAGLAATLQAGLHIWLNYALSLDRRAYVWVLGGVLLLQVGAMLAFGRQDLARMALALVGAGLVGNVAGALLTWAPEPAASRQPAAEAVSP
ncbi:lipopolysaccharide biosynthesis protein [Anaeromyxobacter paludicola]|uniref:Polysaccharide biosynthesis protein n=1 Tax=Anaeromyxobacter paludicola TaxID=2918171 RepID=A0ABM7X6H2_9BACT|nr:hypothetical protein [Anaeromyxobacter paludicola]BDG07432.1 hypothetical protein AMPC_05450 [Anaeromyxobacter paludicola]